MQTILVTGGTGFIGSHTCVSLLKKNYKIIVIDSNINSSKLVLNGVRKIIEKEDIKAQDIIFKKGDLRDEKFLEKVFHDALKNGNEINSVIHFAGLKSVEESSRNPLLYWDNNVCGTANLLKVMEKFNCKVIVFSSSATIYGHSKVMPIKETFKIKPLNPYGQTKAAIEFILEAIYKSSEEDWRIANLRYFNPIGSHESGIIGEDPLDKPNNLFPIICLIASGKYERLNIYGQDWPTYDGTGVRDYIHVMDLADAHQCALEHLFKNDPQFLTLNIGTGIGTSVLDLVMTFQDVNNCEIPYNFCERRIGDVSTLIADNQKALSLLDWQPKRDLKDMCKDGWKWRLLNPLGYEKLLK